MAAKFESKRYRLDLTFDGSDFAGWQYQARVPSVQAVVEAALKKITREKIRLHGASRTDAGVHARHYVAHFDSRTRLSKKRLKDCLNGVLPLSIAVLGLEPVKEDFLARKHARLKTYRYLIFNAPHRHPFYEKRAWHLEAHLDEEAMNQAAALLQGEHDFSSFQAADGKPRPTLKLLEVCRVEVRQRPNLTDHGREIWLELRSKGFLKYMVRNIVGTLAEVGQGKRSAASMSAILEAKDRRRAGRTAPPQGLYLWEIIY